MARVRAPALTGRGGWLGAEPLRLADLLGRVVLLHFWTPGCVGCERSLDDLRQVEDRWGTDEVVVVGVLTPKFDHERSPQAAAAAVARLGVRHPVLLDPDHRTAEEYGVRAWPTVVAVGPDGHVLGTVVGDGHADALSRAVADALGAAVPGPPLPALGRRPPASTLAFPGKVASSADGELVAVADTAHGRVLVLTGVAAGTPALHQAVQGLARPQGVRFRAGSEGWELVVCDTGHDRVLTVDVRPGRSDAEVDGRVLADGIASPFDVVVDPGDPLALVVAEAGRHRLLRLRAGRRPEVVSGTGQEGLEDGPGAKALHAQPSGLATLPGGLLVVDAEASALRAVDVHGRVATLVGTGTFAWGAGDGPAATAGLQHPRGVALAPDRSSAYVADTYNGALRLWSGVDGELRTVPLPPDPQGRGLAEPGGVDVLPDGRLLVADTGHHRLLLVDLAAGTTTVVAVPAAALGHRVHVAASATVEVLWAIDLAGLELEGPVEVAADVEPPSLAAAAGEPAAGPAGVVVVRGAEAGAGRLRIRLSASACDDSTCVALETVIEHPLLVEHPAGRTR